MAPTGDLRDLPWAERHRPRHLGQLVGNTDQVRKLAEWLRDWDDVVLKGKLKAPPENPEHAWMKFKPPPENINARAALVSGPPGIGKTSTCALVVRCCRKYNLMEFNASDERSKVAIDTMSKSLAGNHTLRFGGAGGNLERSVIIMDECDGMAGGGDKGGMQALINMIKTTKSPIICICNDRGHQDVRTLSQSCLDIKFRRPDNAMVAKRIKGILEGEGRKVDALALDSIVESCGHDIRQVLNQVQFFGTTSSSSKQVVLSIFDACTRLFAKETAASKKKLTVESKFDMYYIDADMMPLMVQENYLRTYEKARITSEELAKCAQAAENIAIADSMSGSFETMHSQAAIGTLYPSFLSASEAPFRATFPAWLQKRGPQNKAVRLSQEMHTRLKGSNTSCSSRALVTSAYHDVLHRRLIRPLAAGDAKTCAKALNGLNLTREFFTDQAPALRIPLGLEDGYRKVDGKVKTQLLFELQALQAQGAPQKKRAPPKNEDSEAAPKRGREADDTAMDEDEAPGDTAEGDGDNGMIKSKFSKKKTTKTLGIAKASKPAAHGMSRASLNAWVPKKVQEAQDIADGNDIKKPAGIILKFIEGHTNAVRRKVHIQDFMGPWRLF